ncbi:MerR family transcriptional regulator [Candidatus Magnetobacterium casense]|uniref:MerR family transcriptional regulator n=1 Tax=Candidatus Magnetobacterium casense TaxID=1455061 RepID=UPI000697BF64|nr:MerR family transcriptional regulator [Candidatus Magnetobacterium casensis]
MLKSPVVTQDEREELPHKLFYKIGEVSSITKLEPYVLRYWETEFSFLRPRKGKSRQRMYQKKDIEMLLEIKRLLYEERFTIEGVRKKLGSKYMDMVREDSEDVADVELRETIDMIRTRLREILYRLKEGGA